MFKTSDIREIMLETYYILFKYNWSDILPKVEFIKRKNWKSRLIDKPYDYNRDLFLDATTLYKERELYGCIFQNQSIDDINIIKIKNPSDDDLFDFMFNVLGEIGEDSAYLHHCLITNASLDFMLIKEQEAQFLYIFGEEEFINRALPIKFELYESSFKSSLKDYSKTRDKYNIRKMKLFWETYHHYT